MHVFENKVPFKSTFIDLTVELPTTWNDSCNNNACLILTHGSATDKNFDQLRAISEVSLQSGYMSVRFTYRSPKIIYRALAYIKVLQYISEKYPEVDYFVMGGRSMGSRSATTAANILRQPELLSLEIQSQNFKMSCPDDITSFVHNWDSRYKVIGIIGISYPLNGKNGDVRSKPLFDADCPMLIITGDKDEFCNLDHLKKILRKKATRHSMDSIFTSTSVQSELTGISPLVTFFYDWSPVCLAVFNNSAHDLMVKGCSSKTVIEQIANVCTMWIKALVKCSIENNI